MKSIKAVYKIGSGPSSSHTMGPEKACKDLINAYKNIINVECNLYGSLALTGKGHLTDQIIISTLNPIPTNVHFFITKTLPRHENAMELIATLETGEIIKWIVYSIGGGDIIIDGLVDEQKPANIYPFNLMTDISNYCDGKNISYYDFVVQYEPEVLEYLKEVWVVMQNSIEEGIKAEGFLPGPLKVKRRAFLLNNGESFDRELILSSYAHAVNEQNASGGTIVTAPTCGACGVLPAVLRFYKEEFNLDDHKIIQALAVAGLFGNIVKTNASVSGAEAGCQAEVGTATAMAAAAITYLKGGTNQQIEAAAEIALEHQLGLTCDPIMGYVQIPCIQRNAIGATKARLSAKLALTDSELTVIDFDTVVKVMLETGKDMASSYRETSQGGLAKFYKMKAEKEALEK
ncbi:MAG: L-serine ammonia-lyase, iron-sulfur-dependent, subunit alpha [Mycoplasmatales bacterium]